MKKRRILAVLLLLALLLTACGKAEEGPAPVRETEKPATEAASTEETASTEPGYRAAALRLPRELGKVQAMELYEGVLYAAGNTALYAMDLESQAWSALTFDSYMKGEPGEVLSIAGLTISDGHLYLVTESFFQDTSATGVSMTVYDLETAEVTGVYPLEELARAYATRCRAAGGQLLLSPERENMIYAYSDAGELLYQLAPEGDGILFMAEVEGQTVVCEERGETAELFHLDPESGVLTALCTLEGKPRLPYSSEDGFFWADGSSVYRLDADTGESELLLDWSSSGVSLALAENFAYSRDGSFYALETSAGAIYRVRPYEGPPRKELVIGSVSNYGVYLNHAVALFNSYSEDYEARIETYLSDEFNRVLTEINAGRGPDLLFLSSSVERGNPFNRVSVNSGVLEDLLPYIDADPSLNREDFMPGVLEAMLENGSLRWLSPGFDLATITAPKALADSLSDWTVETLYALSRDLPENYVLFNVFRRDFMMDEFCNFASVEYMDYENGACSFDDPSFARWLELLGSIDYKEDAGGLSAGTMMDFGQTNAWQTHLFRQTYGEHEYMGIPGKNGPVSFFYSWTGSIAILSASQNKAAAWEFISTFLYPEIQEDSIAANGFGAPVIESSFDAAMQKYVANEDLDFTQADAEKLKAATVHASGMARGTIISDMIREEAEKYFTGQRSLEETIRVLQSRAGIYLAEQQ